MIQLGVTQTIRPSEVKMHIQFRCQKLYIYGMISFLVKPFHDLKDRQLCKLIIPQ